MTILKKNKRTLLICAFCILVGVLSVFLISSYSEREKKETALTKLADMCLDGVDRSDHSTLIRSLRQCVHKNTKYQEGEQMFWNAQHRPEMYQKMLKFSMAKEAEAPHAECSLQSDTLKRLFDHLGYEVEAVTIIAMTDRFHDHVIVNVMNPSTNMTEVHDSLFNIHYVLQGENRPLGLREILVTDLDTVSPCMREGVCGWSVNETEHQILPSKMRKTLAAAAVKEDGQYQLIYNANRFDPHKKLTYKGKTRSYCEKRKKHCEKSVIDLLETQQ